MSSRDLSLPAVAAARWADTRPCSKILSRDEGSAGEAHLSLSPPYQLIHDAFQSGQIIPFLGAGASLGPRVPPGVWSATALPPTYLPSGPELTEHLATRAAFPAAESKDLAKVAQYFHVQAGRASLHKTLHGIFSHSYALLPIHTLLASTSKPLLVVTTNYDTLLEQAFSAVGKPFDLVVHTVDASLGERIYHRAHGSTTVAKVLPQKLDVDLTKISVIYKVHGSSDAADPTRDQYVITEDDYIDFLSRLVRNSAIPAFCAEPFQAWPFLFIGYRLGDWNMRVVLNRISSQGRLTSGIVSWAIERQPSPIEERFWQARGVNVYTKEVNDFVAELSGLGPL
jgi:hypothetical protein